MDTTTTPKKEKKGLSKAWKKLRDSFKSKPATTSTSASTSAAAKPTPTKSELTKSEPTKTEPPKETPKDAPKPETTATTQQPGQSDVDRRLEKARAIFKKYDFEFNDEEWQASEPRPKAPRERVQKQIRMRVKYTCHNCKTVYGHDRICVSCQHKRCPECIRYPPKKKKKNKTATKDEPTTISKGCTCHECQSGFDLEATECPNCKHQICDKCTKEAKLDSAPAATSTTPAATSSTPATVAAS